jgi:tetratricopeptide (TPR) repeat protein
VVVSYLRLFVWPSGQSIDHAVAVPRQLLEIRVLAALAALVALAALAAWLWRRSAVGEPGWRLVAFGIGWFFIALSLEAGLVPIQDLMVEHRLYMPLVGLAIAVAAAAASLPSPVSRRAALALLTLSLVPLAVATRARNEVWRDDLTLWRDAELGNPRSPRVLFNIGEILIERGDIAGGEVYLRRALEVNPNFAPALANLGTIAASRGDLAGARRLLERAYDAEPDNWIAAVNLGDLALRRRDLLAARHYYEAAVRAASWEPIPRQRLSALEELERRAAPIAPR